MENKKEMDVRDFFRLTRRCCNEHESCLDCPLNPRCPVSLRSDTEEVENIIVVLKNGKRIMNKFKKYCPNVWLAECTEAHAKGEIIQVENRFGVPVDCEVHNLIRQADGKWFYSIVRQDEPWAKRKAERYRNAAESNATKSAERWNASQEGRDFLSMGEPIKVGHHSEKRHRALFERNWQRMGKSVEYDDKAKKAAELAEYWEGRAEEITLAMPDSLAHFTEELERAREYHAGLKNGTIAKEHSYSLTYAKKKVNELAAKVELAEKLWGNHES